MKANKDFSGVFIEEAHESLEVMEQSLLELESDPENEAVIHQVFRVMHTLKGSSSMFGFQAISDYAHKFETVYDLIRSGTTRVTEEVLEMSYESVDHIRVLLKSPLIEGSALQETHDAKLDSINTLLSQLESTKPKEVVKEEQTQLTTTYFIHLTPSIDVFSKGIEPVYLMDECARLGSSYTFVDDEVIEGIEEYDPSFCLLSWNMILTTNEPRSRLEEIFMFLDEESSIEITLLGEWDIEERVPLKHYLDECSQQKNRFDSDELLKLVESERQKSIKESRSIASPTNTTNQLKDAVSSLRVDVEKLDTLMGLVSELVTTQARMSVLLDDAIKEGDSEIEEVVQDINKISRRLRENAFSISMVPLTTLQTRFQRLVRDLASLEKKKVHLLSEGLETELDKSLIEKLTDPLLHLFRNAIDHGIESPNVRKAKGKPEKGVVTIRSYYAGAHVIIEISDDGAGLPLQKIRSKAISKGLLDHSEVLSDEELADFIFHPGFSTSEQVTEVSGRGVGMDVVRTAINSIRGSIKIKTERDQGTTFSISLPVTLSIIDGLLIRIDESKYLIPLSSIDKCHELVISDQMEDETSIAVIEGEQVPVINLRKLYEAENDRPDIASLIMVKQGDKTAGLLVDSIVGEYQAVLKSLGRMYKNVATISGATILGDGAIALVIDPDALLNEFTNTYKTKTEDE